MASLAKIKKTIGAKYFYTLIIILVAGTFLRFWGFEKSIYFGYDEARDAFDSIAIFTKGDIKISGPAASAFKGINHGPWYLYLIGPLFLLSQGDPWLPSAVFRLFNVLGIIIIFYLGKLYFGKRTGLIAALLFAFSFEQYQYAIFTGNPSVSNIFWTGIFIGAGWIYKHPNKKIKGVLLMLFSASVIAQFDLILSYSFATVAILLFILWKKLSDIKLGTWIKIIFIGLIPIYSYPIAEIKNKFLGIKTFMEILGQDRNLIPEGQTLFSVFFENFIKLINHNFIPFTENKTILLIISVFLLIYIWKEPKNKMFGIFTAVWILSIGALLITQGFMPYYSYAGIGIGVILAGAFFINKLFSKNLSLALVFIFLILLTQTQKIYTQKNFGLIVDIKAQPYMLLYQQKEIIRKSYEFAGLEGFTIHTTTMPYLIQTVWAYLFNQYGYKEYGYLPYKEGGNVLGYPGKLPQPQKGTTCKRILIIEPIRGIPEILINQDIAKENLFSDIVKKEKIGEFTVEYRIASDPNCHNIKAT